MLRAVSGPKISKAVFFALRYGDPVPWAYWRWELVERFGWTLDYIDSLALDDFNEYMQVCDGKAKARK